MFARIVTGCAAIVALSAIAACGGPARATGPHTVKVAASFYPIAYAVQQVGGDHVRVTTLTPDGVEPHEFELTPREVMAVSKADLVVYARGFQASVDKAVQTEAPRKALDVAPAAHLDRSLDGIEQVAGEGGEDTQGTDPHFWLDPVRFAEVAGDITSRLERLDPGHLTAYAAGLERFRAKLSTLNDEFRAGLATCTSKDLVTSHAAFGYLAARYGLVEVGVSGIAPDQMPTPKRLQAVSAFVKKHHVTTIYSETLASPAIAQTIARQTGTTVRVLDPIEGVTRHSAGRTYLAIMRANLGTLRAGQGCH